MEVALISSILIGLGLSSAVGFRIFLPALITSVSAHFNYIELADTMQWMASVPAIITFGVATVAEIAAYYIPFVDNALDAIAAPAAAICGTLLMGSTIIEMDPFIKWPISVIAGGGLATTVHGGTSLLRIKSSGFTAGLGNPMLSSLESFVSLLLSVISIVLPVLAGVLVLWIIYSISKTRRSKSRDIG